MLQSKAKKLLEAGLQEDEALFLIDFTVSLDNKIRVVIDGDFGVTVEDCMKISRTIEHNLDREEEDFSLEVASAGASTPLSVPRQYIKNIGRKLEVTFTEGAIEGTLTEVREEGIYLEWKAREPKPIGKGKVTVQKKQFVDFKEINKAKVILKF